VNAAAEAEAEAAAAETGTGTELASLIRERLNLQVVEVYSLLIRPGIAPGFIFLKR